MHGTRTQTHANSNTLKFLFCCKKTRACTHKHTLKAGGEITRSSFAFYRTENRVSSNFRILSDNAALLKIVVFRADTTANVPIRIEIS